MRSIFVISSIAIISAFISCSPSTSVNNKDNTTTVTEERPLNIILMIADGGGLSQISASQFYNPVTSNYERFKHIGLIKTSSSSDLVTDSAAGATAFACGIKTYNGAVGVDNNINSKPTILEELSSKGYKTGLVATSSITHATPASFYAHVAGRSLKEEIAEALVDSKVDFFAGGGLKYFNNRSDNKNLIQDFQSNGFEVNTSFLNIDAFLSPEKKYGYLLANKGMPKMTEDRGPFLKNATFLGLKYLSQEQDPFFMMVEGSQIDWACHENDVNYLVKELIDFDNTLGYVLDFVEQEGNTLLIVTADHETGGFTLAAQENDYNTLEPIFSTNGHSATMVPVFAYGPGADNFSGIYENTEIYHKIKRILSH